MVQFSTTLAPQAIKDLEMILGQKTDTQVLTADGHATLDVSASDFSDVFWFRTNSNNFSNDEVNDDLKFYCISANLVEVNFGEAIVDEADIVPIGKPDPNARPIKQDMANWSTRLVLGTGGADLLDNEEQLVAHALSKNSDLYVSMKLLLQTYGGTPDAPRNNVPDTQTTDSNTINNNNYARQMLLSSIYSAQDGSSNVMIDRINSQILALGGPKRVVADFMPINPQPGDSLILYAAYGSNNELRLGSQTGPQINPAREQDYLDLLKSKNPLFPNGDAAQGRMNDTITGAAKSWHVYKVTLNLN